VADETLVEWLAQAITGATFHVRFQGMKPEGDDWIPYTPSLAAEKLLATLAAPDSPVLLVPRGEVTERIERQILHMARAQWVDVTPYHAEVDGKRYRRRLIHSWDTPDGSHVEVTGPWTEVEA
jgi:hypothetical protein